MNYKLPDEIAWIGPDLRQLRYYAEEIKTKAQKKITNDDYFGVMAFCFLASQLERFDSMRILITHEHFEDASTISRCMLEGAAILRWTLKNGKVSLSRKWGQFQAVSNWRTIRDLEKENGPPVNPQIKAKIDLILMKDGRKFFKDKHKKAGLKMSNIPNDLDPFIPYWHEQKTISVFFKDLEALVFYRFFYSRSSEWTHWTPASLAGNAKFTEGVIHAKYKGKGAVVPAVLMGFQSVLQTSIIMSEHLKLDYTSTLRIIDERCIEILEKKRDDHLGLY